ncbi:MAG TPA: hypothetical protein PKG63_01495 [Bacteroidales bacterium]|jgi:hypothetical protein|nr:hypothetical protein [Bacteroidales bacterium]HOU98575.1 hypothetical protein [Bacteroidales bacterium]
MRLVGFLLFFYVCTGIKAQLEVPTQELIHAFLKTKTYFVLEDNPFSEANIQLKTAAQKFWKLTPYDFISVEEFESKRKSNQYSFVSVDDIYYELDKSSTKYKFLCVYMGGNYKNESDMPQLCTIPLAYSDQEENEYAYKIGTLLIFVQNHIKQIKENPTLKKSTILDYYNNNKGNLQNKTLYLKNNEVEKKINTENAFKNIYPYPFKFVSQDEIEKAIDNKSPDIVFLHKVGPGKKNGYRSYQIILGAQDAQIYFFDYHMVNDDNPDALLEKEVKKMIKK